MNRGEAREIESVIMPEDFCKAFRVMKPLSSKIIGTLLAVVVIAFGGYLAIPRWQEGVMAMVPGLIVAALAVFYLVWDYYLFYRHSVKKKYQALCKAEGTDFLIRKLILHDNWFTYEAAGKVKDYTYEDIRKKYRWSGMGLWLCGNQMIFKKEME